MAFSLLLFLVGSVAPAAAFHAVPAGSSIHDKISAEAADAVGMPGNLVQAIKQATRRPDYDDGKAALGANGTLMLKTTDVYRASHHCDRIPPMTDAAAFQDTAAYVAGERANATAAMRAAHEHDAVWALGRALHAMQDCFAHSNLVDMGPEAWAAARRALLENGAAPAGLQVTGFDPKAKYNMMPPGDPYPYAIYNKDAPKASDESQIVMADGRTKFEVARAEAVNVSRDFLAQFNATLNATQREALFETWEEGPPFSVPVPEPPLALPIAALALAAFARSRATTP